MNNGSTYGNITMSTLSSGCLSLLWLKRTWDGFSWAEDHAVMNNYIRLLRRIVLFPFTNRSHFNTPNLNILLPVFKQTLQKSPYPKLSSLSNPISIEFLPDPGPNSVRHVCNFVFAFQHLVVWNCPFSSFRHFWNVKWKGGSHFWWANLSMKDQNTDQHQWALTNS